MRSLEYFTDWIKANVMSALRNVGETVNIS